MGGVDDIKYMKSKNNNGWIYVNFGWFKYYFTDVFDLDIKAEQLKSGWYTTPKKAKSIYEEIENAAYYSEMKDIMEHM